MGGTTDTNRSFFDSKIQAQIDADRASCVEHGWKFNERSAGKHTIGDFVRAVLAIENVDDARRFYLGCVAHIQAQIDAGTWQSGTTANAEEGARSNIGWCYGEGMSPERCRMWVEACGAVHPVFGAGPVGADEALKVGREMGRRAAESGARP
jgi:hypothetical protein